MLSPLGLCHERESKITERKNMTREEQVKALRLRELADPELDLMPNLLGFTVSLIMNGVIDYDAEKREFTVIGPVPENWVDYD
jgi:hypothetical protein